MDGDSYMETVRFLIEEYRSVNQMSMKAFAESCGLAEKTVYRFMNGKNINMNTFLKICQGLHMEPGQIRNYFDDLVQATRIVMDHLRIQDQYPSSLKEIKEILKKYPAIVDYVKSLKKLG